MTDEDVVRELAERLGPLYLKRRLGVEGDHEEQALGQKRTLFRLENPSAIIASALKLAGLYSRARRNAERVVLRRTEMKFTSLPKLFDDFTILHISDMHTDLSEAAMRCVVELVKGVRYDLCVLTGDYRGRTFGSSDRALEGTARVTAHLKKPIFGVLGNHDTIKMVPAMEAMGIDMLINECAVITRGAQQVYLAGIDDAHFFRTHNIEKAASLIPESGFSILLSHTPEIFRQAANADFNLLLSGHTHGGQLCLPGSIPIMLDAAVPRSMGAGAWRYKGMRGYTSAGAGSSVIAVRLNCPPEITLHRLRCG